MIKHATFTTAFLLISLAGCAEAEAGALAETTVAEVPVSSAQSMPNILVYKTPSCGCCNGWIEHLQAAGFSVEGRNLRDLMSIKRDAGVPVGLSSCHTALVGGYVVEGHVPVEQVKRMLAEQPDISGIAVPGMPIGSPGMEGPNAKPYQVISFDDSGNARVYAEIDPR